MINYDQLDPGIRQVVRQLNDLGFVTTDSGDGVSKTDMEGAMDVPNVAIKVDPFYLLGEADRLYRHCAEWGLEDFTIQASYDPVDGSAVILLLGVDDSTLRAERRGRRVSEVIVSDE